MMTKRVREILSYYDGENPGVRANLARFLNHGRLAGTGKFVILPVDRGLEHGPVRSFAPNPPACNPRYHFELAIEAGCNAFERIERRGSHAGCRAAAASWPARSCCSCPRPSRDRRQTAQQGIADVGLAQKSHRQNEFGLELLGERGTVATHEEGHGILRSGELALIERLGAEMTLEEQLRQVSIVSAEL